MAAVQDKEIELGLSQQHCPQSFPRQRENFGVRFGTGNNYPRSENLAGAVYTVIDTRRMRHHGLLCSPHQFLHGDITDNNLPGNHYDLVLCNNTLPYVRDYQTALKEIRRVLKPSGIAMLNTHWQAGPTQTALEHRHRHLELTPAFYAENGDQWVFGEDFLHRVQGAEFGLQVWEPYHRLNESCLVRNGLKRDTVLVLAWKTRAAEETLRSAVDRFANPTPKMGNDRSVEHHRWHRNGARFPPVAHL